MAGAAPGVAEYPRFWKPRAPPHNPHGNWMPGAPDAHLNNLTRFVENISQGTKRPSTRSTLAALNAFNVRTQADYNFGLYAYWHTRVIRHPFGDPVRDVWVPRTPPRFYFDICQPWDSIATSGAPGAPRGPAQRKHRLLCFIHRHGTVTHEVYSLSVFDRETDTLHWYDTGLDIGLTTAPLSGQRLLDVLNWWTSVCAQPENAANFNISIVNFTPHMHPHTHASGFSGIWQAARKFSPVGFQIYEELTIFNVIAIGMHLMDDIRNITPTFGSNLPQNDPYFAAGLAPQTVPRLYAVVCTLLHENRLKGTYGQNWNTAVSITGAQYNINFPPMMQHNVRQVFNHAGWGAHIPPLLRTPGLLVP
ncbi:hypothetical protein F4780DRAFT_782817 [Xylariomycetidae sp. FL0641]|nr:hypothetical protein F4780DRAFT_782817 [Xylariomycetidae sp. FL0641]